jgi:DNA-binding GntR family transcriptional regulator
MRSGAGARFTIQSIFDRLASAPTRPDDRLASSNKPRYLAIADLIAADIKTGRLAIGDRLPPQRKLASRLEIDFTTVARGYAEAQKRGLIESRVGQGTYVRSAPNGARAHAPPGRGGATSSTFR